jgi:uncharacterized SAM-binding protein YcdF (DUF218 family)
VKEDHPGHADVMVMLMGSLTDRILHTADLYHEDVAHKVWIVEDRMGHDDILEERGVQIMSNSTRARFALIDLGIPADSIILLPGGANSTRMEAEIVRDYMRTQHVIDTLLLVSSSGHTRRAHKIFKAAMSPLREINNNPFVVSCSPSTYSSFHPDKWWKSKEDVQTVITENLKMMNFFLFEKRELRNEK